ncbi:MAG: PA2779 family protein [Thermoanaerobaculia bacterium]|nr:PA2779 family protein [Thermoanaerobaculia bacterium]
MRKNYTKKSIVRGLCLVLAVLFAASTPAPALEAPSKTAADQSLAEREADLAVLVTALEDEAVVQAIEAHGFTVDQVHARLAQLSPEELQQLSTQVDQLQAAGLQPPRYIWILLGILIAVVILATIF